MKKKIFRSLKHIFETITVLLILGVITLVALNGTFDSGYNLLKLNLENEGPNVFYDTGSTLKINYIKGNKTDDFFLDKN